MTAMTCSDSLLQKTILLRVAFDCSNHVRQLRELADHYADRKPGMADLCLIRSANSTLTIP